MSQSVVSSSVGSVSMSRSRDRRSVSSSLTEAQETTDRWLEQFLNEMDSALPYKRHRVTIALPCQKRQRQGSSRDWEWVLCQLSAPLAACLMQRSDLAAYRACRQLSRACRLAFSCATRRLTIRNVTSKRLATSLLTAFKSVTAVHVSHHVGYLHSKLRLCTQLRELSFEPVHSAGHKEDQLSIIRSLHRLEKLRLWGPIGGTSVGLKHLTALRNLTSLSLGSKLQIHGSDLYIFASCWKLQTLELVGCTSLDDSGLSVFSQLTILTTLRLSIAVDGHCRVSSTGIRFLSHLTTLCSLDLARFTTLRESDLTHLSHLLQLTQIKLNGLHGMAYTTGWCVPSLITLRELSLRHLPSLEDVALVPLSQLTQLTTLHVGNCPNATDATVAALCTLDRLEHLKIDRFPWLTEQGLDALLHMTSIQTLKVTGVYSISGDAFCEAVVNNGLSYDVDAWRHQIILLSKHCTA